MFWKHVDLRSQTLYVEKIILRKSLHVLEDIASGCASDDIKQVIFKKNNMINYMELMTFYKNNWWQPRVYNELR